MEITVTDDIAIQSASLREVAKYLKQVQGELVRVDDLSVDFKDTGAHDKICDVLREANSKECGGDLLTYFSKDIGIKKKLDYAIRRIEEITG